LPERILDARGANAAPEVFVLASAHHYHEIFEGYSYWHLEKLLVAYGPDLVAIEVTPERFRRADFRMDSPEKWGIVLPWARKRGVPVIAMDGVSPEFTPRQSLTFEEARRHYNACNCHTYEETASDILRRACARWGYSDDHELMHWALSNYERVHGRQVQEFFRSVHGEMEAVFGEGPLSGNWTPRNRTMAHRVVEGVREYGALRPAVVVGGEHKYALDDLLAAKGWCVRQLEDFLNKPITMTLDEVVLFRRGTIPITYPSDLMFIHRQLYGGEPDSFMPWNLPRPERSRCERVRARIQRALRSNPSDPDMLYYRGLLWYVLEDYARARVDFLRSAEGAEDDHKVGAIYPLSQLALLRAGQMMDLSGQRLQALGHYREVLAKAANGSSVATLAEALIEEPYRQE
jgi:tetratricopeptide (TPR) repeat protein